MKKDEWFWLSTPSCAAGNGADAGARALLEVPWRRLAVSELVLEHPLTSDGGDLKTLESFCRWCFRVVGSVLQTASVYLCKFPVVPQSRNLAFIVFTPPCF